MGEILSIMNQPVKPSPKGQSHSRSKLKFPRYCLEITDVVLKMWLHGLHNLLFTNENGKHIDYTGHCLF